MPSIDELELLHGEFLWWQAKLSDDMTNDEFIAVGDAMIAVQQEFIRALNDAMGGPKPPIEAGPKHQ